MKVYEVSKQRFCLKPAVARVIALIQIYHSGDPRVRNTSMTPHLSEARLPGSSGVVKKSKLFRWSPVTWKHPVTRRSGHDLDRLAKKIFCTRVKRRWSNIIFTSTLSQNPPLDCAISCNSPMNHLEKKPQLHATMSQYRPKKPKKESPRRAKSK